MIDLWTMTRWKDAAELLVAIREKADTGKNVVISPATARLLLMMIQTTESQRKQRNPWDINLHAVGSCVCRLDDKGDVEQIDAWARSSAIGKAALASLKEAHPTRVFEQRRGGWIEGR